MVGSHGSAHLPGRRCASEPIEAHEETSSKSATSTGSGNVLSSLHKRAGTTYSKHRTPPSKEVYPPQSSRMLFCCMCWTSSSRVNEWLGYTRRRRPTSIKSRRKSRLRRPSLMITRPLQKKLYKLATLASCSDFNSRSCARLPHAWSLQVSVILCESNYFYWRRRVLLMPTDRVRSCKKKVCHLRLQSP